MYKADLSESQLQRDQGLLTRCGLFSYVPQHCLILSPPPLHCDCKHKAMPLTLIHIPSYLKSVSSEGGSFKNFKSPHPLPDSGDGCDCLHVCVLGATKTEDIAVL